MGTLLEVAEIPDGPAWGLGVLRAEADNGETDLWLDDPSFPESWKSKTKISEQLI